VHFNLEYFLYLLPVLAVIWMLLKRRGDISSAEARRMVQTAGARLVDVRTPDEFVSRHIEGAVNIPVGDLDQSLKKLGPRDRPVVLYCASGARSALAARVLKQNGFKTVRNLGAMSRW
jgi:rhodanese-related sulfurtransferase